MNDESNLLSQLADALDLAFSTPPQPGKEREPVIDALVAVARFARAVGSRDAAWGLTELAYALQDLGAGRVAPVLQKAKRDKGSPPDSSVIWMKRVRVLIAVDALQKSGMNEEEAARYIDKKYPELQSLMTRGKRLPSSIMRWRREMAEAKQGTFLGIFAKQLLDMQEDVKSISPSPMSPDRWREFADNMLAGIQPKILTPLPPSGP